MWYAIDLDGTMEIEWKCDGMEEESDLDGTMEMELKWKWN